MGSVHVLTNRKHCYDESALRVDIDSGKLSAEAELLAASQFVMSSLKIISVSGSPWSQVLLVPQLCCVLSVSQ